MKDHRSDRNLWTRAAAAAARGAPAMALAALVALGSCGDSGGAGGDAAADMPAVGDLAPRDSSPRDGLQPDSVFMCQKSEADVSPTHPHIEYIGRFERTAPDKPRFEWPGTAIRIRFKGAAITTKLGKDAQNYFNLILDSDDPITMKADGVDPFEHTLSGLKDGVHTLTLFKRTEHLPVKFLGVSLPEGGCLLPPRKRARRLLFVGDSITAGYGNEGADKSCKFTYATENNYLAYGAITSRNVDAAYTCLAISGRGVYRNYSGSTQDTMPVMINRTLPSAPGAWDWKAEPAPDMVVVNLGTNDFAKGDPGAANFTGAYDALIADLREHFPGVNILCLLGPMFGGSKLTTARGYIKGVVNKARGAGDKKIHFLEFKALSADKDYGCGWHPSVSANLTMAAALSAEVKKILGW